MLLQFDLIHIHKVNFYPSDNNFTQALLVMLVTNMTSGVEWCGVSFHFSLFTFYFSLIEIGNPKV